MEPVKKKKKRKKKMEGKGRVGKKDTGVEERCKKVGQPQIARRGRRKGGGKDELSHRRSAFSGEGEKRKVVVGGERKEGGEKRERERERNCAASHSFSQWRQKHPCFFFSFRGKKKEIKNSSSSFSPSSPLFLILAVKNKEKK